jgi:hypothetical protein
MKISNRIRETVKKVERLSAFDKVEQLRRTFEDLGIEPDKEIRDALDPSDSFYLSSFTQFIYTDGCVVSKKRMLMKFTDENGEDIQYKNWAFLMLEDGTFATPAEPIK